MEGMIDQELRPLVPKYFRGREKMVPTPNRGKPDGSCKTWNDLLNSADLNQAPLANTRETHWKPDDFHKQLRSINYHYLGRMDKNKA
ncbi:hypothetical protein DFQ28_008232 [Apophysomyces sp. BC1034]|nr:hypothetical protein DFQ28_008232 [Apophysomyces sp. BC1034]